MIMPMYQIFLNDEKNFPLWDNFLRNSHTINRSLARGLEIKEYLKPYNAVFIVGNGSSYYGINFNTEEDLCFFKLKFS